MTYKQAQKFFEAMVDKGNLTPSIRAGVKRNFNALETDKKFRVEFSTSSAVGGVNLITKETMDDLLKAAPEYCTFTFSTNKLVVR